MGNKIIEALVDSGSSVSLIREDVKAKESSNLRNSRRHFSIDRTGKELMRKGIVIIYMDDLVIPAKDEKEGLEKLREVLEVASKYGLEMKFKNVNSKKKSRILGHFVENGQYVLQLQKQ
ncbi:transposon Tf2-9 polyprotein [Trichonephila clavipes]|nr:transposon Tf2-9 polyprotein [Trichonephila clavipes]